MDEKNRCPNCNALALFAVTGRIYDEASHAFVIGMTYACVYHCANCGARLRVDVRPRLTSYAEKQPPPSLLKKFASACKNIYP